MKILIIILAFAFVAIPFMLFHDGTWSSRLNELKPIHPDKET